MRGRSKRQKNALTIITPIKPGEGTLKSLGDLLERINTGRSKHPVEFDKIDTTCFASWIILDRDPDGGDYPPALVFECNYEGSLDEYLDAFITRAGDALRDIYAHCAGFTEKSNAFLRKYLLKHRKKHAAFFVGCPEQSRQGIRQAKTIRDGIENVLDQNPMYSSRPQEIQAAIRARVKSELDGLITPIEKLQGRAFRNWVLVIVAAIVGFVFWVPAAVIWLLLIRRRENRESSTPDTTKREVDRRLFGSEDRYTQNHLTTLVQVQPGLFRLISLRVVLWLINFAAAHIYITGALGGYPTRNGHRGGIATIHFARWLIIDTDQKGRNPRLLFLSNFDGSWNSYLGDFADKAPFGLNAVWGNTVAFPPTRFLFMGGSRAIDPFKQWSREHNLPANVWYSAYPEISVRNIITDIHIADQLDKQLDDQQAREFLQLL